MKGWINCLPACLCTPSTKDIKENGRRPHLLSIERIGRTTEPLRGAKKTEHHGRMEIEFKFCIPDGRLKAVEAALKRGAVVRTRLQARYFESRSSQRALVRTHFFHTSAGGRDGDKFRPD